MGRALSDGRRFLSHSACRPRDELHITSDTGLRNRMPSQLRQPGNTRFLVAAVLDDAF